MTKLLSELLRRNARRQDNPDSISRARELRTETMRTRPLGLFDWIVAARGVY